VFAERGPQHVGNIFRVEIDIVLHRRLIEAFRISFCNTAGITRMAQRSPNARRRP
jgi:hypothetical protein